MNLRWPGRRSGRLDRDPNHQIVQTLVHVVVLHERCDPIVSVLSGARALRTGPS